MSFKSFAEYVTEETKEVVVAWGRYNPPTIGHEKLMTVVKRLRVAVSTESMHLNRRIPKRILLSIKPK